MSDAENALRVMQDFLREGSSTSPDILARHRSHGAVRFNQVPYHLEILPGETPRIQIRWQDTPDMRAEEVGRQAFENLCQRGFGALYDHQQRTLRFALGTQALNAITQLDADLQAARTVAPDVTVAYRDKTLEGKLNLQGPDKGAGTPN